MEEITIGVSILGFSSLLSMMVYNSRKNAEQIRALCERIARLEGILEGRFSK